MCQGKFHSKKMGRACEVLETMQASLHSAHAVESSESSDATELSEDLDQGCVQSAAPACKIEFVSHSMRDGKTASWASTPISLVSLFLVMGIVHIYFILLVFCWMPPVLVLLALLAGSLLLPRPSEEWEDWFQEDNTMFDAWEQYFSMTASVEYDYTKDPDTHYIITAAPHGAFPISAILTGHYMKHVLVNKTRHLAASCLFNIPLWRQFYQLLSCHGASRKNMLELLKKGNVLVVVGGIAEMFMLHDHKEQILLSKRKGLIRVAVETGSPIVPTYEFGSSHMTKFGPNWLRNVSRTMRASLGIVYGRCYLPIPFATHLHVAVGPPVLVKQMSPDDPAYAEQVDEVHQRYIDAVEGLYERHRHEYGWGERPLVIH